MTESIQEKQEARRTQMLEAPVWKIVPAIALPMVISMIIDSVYNLADTFFVSSLGTAATGAVGVNNSLMGFIRAIAMAFGVGAASYISRLLGAKQGEEASRTASTALVSAVAVMSVLAGIAFGFREPLVMLLGATEGASAFSVEYATYILLAAPFTAITTVLGQVLRAEGSTTYSMFGMVSGCIVNLALDPLFIFVFKWGVSGAAGATAISKVISCIVLAIPFWRKKSLVEIKLKLFTPKWHMICEIARMGIPTFLRVSIMSVASVFTNDIAGSYSDSALAAVSVSNRVLVFVGSIVIGFGQGFQPIAGYCWGAKRYKRIKSAFWTTSAIGLIVCAFFGTILFVFAPQIADLFTKDDPEIIRVSAYIIRAQCLTLPFHVWIMVIIGMFQALGRALQAGILGLSRQVISFIPCLFILTALYGLQGLMVAQAVADVITVIFALPFFIPMMHKLTKLEQREIESGSEVRV